MNEIYQAMKKILAAGGFDKAKETKKLDLFLALNRLTIGQYEELSAMISA